MIGVHIVPVSNRMEVQQSLPPGLIIIENFITSDEEETLMNLMKWSKCDEQQCNAVLKHRQVQHFGYEFRYDTNNVDVNKPLIDAPIPNECDFLWDRLRSQHISTPAHQLTVNKYEPGQGKMYITHFSMHKLNMFSSLFIVAIQVFHRMWTHTVHSLHKSFHYHWPVMW